MAAKQIKQQVSELPTFEVGRSITFETPTALRVTFDGEIEYTVSGVTKIQIVGASQDGRWSLMCYQQEGSVTLIPAVYALLVIGAPNE